MQSLIYKVFTRKYSLSLQADALLLLNEVIEENELSPRDAAKWLELLADTWTKREEGRPLVEAGPLRELVAAVAAGTSSVGGSGGVAAALAPAGAPALAAMAAEGASDLFTVVSAFDVPTLWYDPAKRAFAHPFDKADILSPAEAKAALFRQRYDLLKQRTLRNENFMPVSFSDQEKDRFYTLSTIDSLQGREGERFLLFGMLSQLEEGRLSLEDRAGSIELDFSQLSGKSATPSGLFTESSFVLVDGYVEDGVFRVEEIGLPPPETRDKTRAAFPNVNFFGGMPSLRTETQLRAIEAANDSGIVFLSDVWLDRQETMDALQTLFEGLSRSAPPIAFVFTGDFASRPFVAGSGDTAQYRDNMAALGQLIGGFPEIARRSHFVFVPGANDPWGQGALPKPRIAEFFTQRLESRLAHVTFTTNPCRIRYCTHEIAVFREDLLKRVRRNCVLPPAESTEIVKHLVRTVVGQGHLCPLPQRVRPVYWAYDHAMRVYPVPDVLVLADRFDPYSVNYEGCHSINPGSFSGGDQSFFMYFPASRTSQYSRVPRS
ncbi:DNA-directed DNA polymerase epsilon, subunit B [Coemansia biformis]|uniref:DNA polymerase epsilon subunit n=1 Tax=Coemansia biformis TaxID=1286918 RepID=A0A9W7Y773_9FUNG|nr:DNA-directed DNA polymerase epsilon, subunit B [Coemansia biformis]